MATNTDVVHAWANQTKQSAKTSNGRFYFNGDTIYSYGSHFPIAKHVTNDRGEKAILFTTSTYSNTTAKHISYTRRGTWGNVIYCASPNNTHEENFRKFLVECEIILEKLPKAKKPEIYLLEVDNVKQKVEKYTSFFGLEIPVNLVEILSIKDKTEYSVYNDRKIEFERIEREKKHSQMLEKIKNDLIKWRNFEIHYLYDKLDFDFLRYNKETKEFETSQRVKIPLEIGVKFYHWIKSIIAKGGCNDCNYKVLDYKVRSVTADTIVIGCHTIQIEEIENVFKEINL